MSSSVLGKTLRGILAQGQMETSLAIKDASLVPTVIGNVFRLQWWQAQRRDSLIRKTKSIQRMQSLSVTPLELMKFLNMFKGFALFGFPHVWQYHFSPDRASASKFGARVVSCWMNEDSNFKFAWLEV